ncbi:uncharacterized protein CLV36_1148 [Laceyella sediminis]|uniref:HD domain-containing protein n=1 Tax=Laceyella sediminis TaxID=573074 RepID=A0ABX5EKH1_9BACL|nr:hypothetical protein [Laceyella sediminis]PRZ12345.1 uncharacterized protein CLV36_1148 [Laceyella sediminis]
MDVQRLEDFCWPFYEEKDMMHNLDHIHRVLKMACQIAKPYQDQIDQEVLIAGAYFHGIINKEENRNQILNFLESQGVNKEKMQAILQAAEGSQKDFIPETLEGKILHDAHLLEGGKTFLIVKSLITGSLRGQSLEETIRIVEEKLLDRFICALPENKALYKEKEKFARELIQELKPYL